MSGSVGDDEPRELAEKRLKDKIKDDEPTRVYHAMNNNKINVTVEFHPHECLNCRSFFHYEHVMITSEGGRYTEKRGICPTCGREGRPVEMDDLKGEEEYGRGKCKCRCPKCHSEMIVTSSGIGD